MRKYNFKIILILFFLLIFSLILFSEENDIWGAIYSGNLEKVKMFIEDFGVDVNSTYQYIDKEYFKHGDSLIYIAVRFQKYDIVEYLISKNVDLYAVNVYNSKRNNILLPIIDQTDRVYDNIIIPMSEISMTKKIFDIIFNELIKDKKKFLNLLNTKLNSWTGRNVFNKISDTIRIRNIYDDIDIKLMCTIYYIYNKVYNNYKDEYTFDLTDLRNIIITDNIGEFKKVLSDGNDIPDGYTILSIIFQSENILDLLLKLKITNNDKIKQIINDFLLNTETYEYFEDINKIGNFIKKYLGIEMSYKYLYEKGAYEEAKIFYENNKKLLDDFFLENSKEIISCLKKDYTNEFVDLILKDVQNLNNTDYKSLEDFIIGKLIDQNYYESKKILFVKGNLDKYFFEDNNNQYVLLRNIITELLSGKDIIYKIILEAKKLKLNDNNLKKIEEFIKIYNIPLEKKELDLINQDFKYNFKFKKILKFLESICNS